jgi:glycosyltransferase involved in cell wall biosynthesis
MMNILVTVDPELPVPPLLYGGIERIADKLIGEYKRMGHRVILVANSASTCSYADQLIGWKGARSQQTGSVFINSLQLFFIVLKYKPDVIHSFSRLLYLYPLLLLRKTRIVQSYQRMISKTSTGLFSFLAGNKVLFTACAGHLFHSFKDPAKWTCIFNFTDIDFFTLPENTQGFKSDYFMFLGRIEEIKGVHEAIEAVLKTPFRLVIAGNIPAGQEAYFKAQVEPFLAAGKIEYKGALADPEKRGFLQGARALLFPIKWEEPFGIVMAESMACGCPVIAFNRGSVPEVIQEGRNGCIVSTVDEMVIAMDSIEKVNRDEVRMDAVSRFSSKHIAISYLELFNKLTKAA